MGNYNEVKSKKERKNINNDIDTVSRSNKIRKKAKSILLIFLGIIVLFSISMVIRGSGSKFLLKEVDKQVKNCPEYVVKILKSIKNENFEYFD